LLEFTHEYLKDNPNIKGFYMNHLDYGLNKGDLLHYQDKELLLANKVGGAYSCREQKSDSLESTNEKYYLVSLQNDTFHCFDPEVLLQQKPPTFISFEKLMQDSLGVLLKGNHDPDELPAKLLEKHPLEITSFYGSPALKNPVFSQDVQKWAHALQATVVLLPATIHISDNSPRPM